MKKLIVAGILICTQHIYAEDLPLSVENYVAERGKIKLESGLVYSNIKTKNYNTGVYAPIYVGYNAYINVPRTVTKSRIQDDILIATVGVKYGLTKKMDIYSRTNSIYRSTRPIETNSDTQSTSSTNFSDLSLGANYQFTQDAKYPALIGFFETSLIEKGVDKMSHFRSFTTGFTTYRSYDPIVLSLSAGYRHNLSRTHEEPTYSYEYTPSNLFFLNPQIAFSANDKISLIAGLNFKNVGAVKLNNQTYEKSHNDMDYSFGVGFGLSDQSNLNFTTTIKQTFEASSSDFRLNYTYSF